MFAYRKYNHTRILLEAGSRYEIKVVDVEQYKWNDGGVMDLDGNGWDRDDVRLGLKEMPIAAMEAYRRVTAGGAKWFSLCGCIEEDDSTAFVIGNGVAEYIPLISGELCTFANDLDGYYGNNTGKLKIQVKKC